MYGEEAQMKLLVSLGSSVCARSLMPCLAAMAPLRPSWHTAAQVETQQGSSCSLGV